MQKLILVAWLAAGAAGEEVVWIEAEQFQSHGGWTNDAQFIDQMGSSYLLAIGLGTPVEDAVTTVRLSQAGTYRLWVRAKDWVPEHHPGLFEMSVGGRTIDRVFGGSGRRGWIWEEGGVHEPEIGRLFHSLGVFELPAGRGTSVVVETADTDGYVVVDALQLLQR